MTMVRKQVFITVEQNRLLKQRAKATRRPEAACSTTVGRSRPWSAAARSSVRRFSGSKPAG